MWKASVGHDVSVTAEAAGDDWDTDPDFVNDITEKEQRWGAKTVEGSGRPQHIDINQLRSNVSQEHEHQKKKEHLAGPQASYGYGGQFGTERDRMDKSAQGHDYRAELGKHSSQTDAAKGFGGKYGVQKDRTDKSAVGFEYKAQLQQHSSQQDQSQGFGGKFGCVVVTSGARDLKCRFERIAGIAEEETRQRAEEERGRRQKRETPEREQRREPPRITEKPRVLLPEQIPVPVPRVSPRTPQEPIATEETWDPDYEEPPAVPPKLPEREYKAPPAETYREEEESYEDIPDIPSDREEEYEAIPDLPHRREEEKEEDYESILESPQEDGEDLYEEMPREKEPRVMAPSHPVAHTDSSGISAVALYDYEGDKPTHRFQPGDKVVVKRLPAKGGTTEPPYGLPTTILAVTRTAVLTEDSSTWIHASRIKSTKE
ncbi:uncharacterized protein LOC142494329 [Ascaphus truei]|uniref:uncharacterized protein LOC142494329 n=1 Tax=Ascaphus truei TaxID=8439 RepID=UPI003F5A99E1